MSKVKATIEQWRKMIAERDLARTEVAEAKAELGAVIARLKESHGTASLETAAKLLAAHRKSWERMRRDVEAAIAEWEKVRGEKE